MLRGDDVPARYGGEEFAIIVPDTSLQGATLAAHRIRQRLARDGRLSVNSEEVRFTSSFGVSVAPDHANDPEHLIGLADAALYEAKRSGKNAVRAAPDTGH